MPTSAQDIKDEIFRFVCEDAALDRTEIAEDTLLFSGGYIDSITVTGLIALVEKLTGTLVPQSEVTLENFDSVARLTAYASLRIGQ